ncbi:hypothetical protein [Chromobacterium sphagni]|nr:hypothetical protein [Chromobacterium sphagni]
MAFAEIGPFGASTAGAGVGAGCGFGSDVTDWIAFADCTTGGGFTTGGT